MLRPFRCSMLCVPLLGFFFAVVSSVGKSKVQSEPVNLTKNSRQWTERTLKSLSLGEKVGQMLQVRYYVDYKSFDTFAYKYVRDEVQKYHIGSVVLGMHFDRSGPLRSTPSEAARCINQLQTDSTLPLLIAADVERGVATRLTDVPDFPWPMAFGAADDPKEIEEFGAITARQARAVGINWALAPVADVNSNPANPIINDRSFGEDPEQVGALVAAYIRGARENGILVTAKHFPGQGDTVIDSHLGVPTISGDMAHLEKYELPPFKSAIEAGVDSIMLAHARVPALEPDPERISTISPKVVSGFLIKRLGFKGVVLTDALEMRGITNLYQGQKENPSALAAVDAVKAGDDVIMIPTNLPAAFNAIVNAVKSGEIPESRIDESVLKILAMKAEVGLDKSRLVDVEKAAALAGDPKDMAFAQHVADEAVTLVRNNKLMLPLQKQSQPSSATAPNGKEAANSHDLVVILLAQALEDRNGVAFEQALKNHRPDAKVFQFEGRFSGASVPDVLKAVKEAQQVVVAAYVVHQASQKVVVNGKSEQTYGLEGPSGDLLKQVLTVAPEKTAVVALGSPYLIESFPEIQTYICTYAMASTSEISAVKALFGEIQNHAKLPVALPGVAARSFSLPWPVQKSKDAHSQAPQSR